MEYILFCALSREFEMPTHLSAYSSYELILDETKVIYTAWISGHSHATSTISIPN